MNITMTDSRLSNFNQLETFLGGTKEISFASLNSKAEKYNWIREILSRFDFRHLRKKERGIVRGYLKKISGYSDSQLTRLVKRYFKGNLVAQIYRRNLFPTKYEPKDIALLVKTDNVHSRLNGWATKNILVREFEKFKKPEYEKIAEEIIENLRKEWKVSYDKSGSIGRRYARNDEIGTPYCITIDDQTASDKTVTVRWRDTGEQVRIKIKELKEVLRQTLYEGKNILSYGKKVDTRKKEVEI